MSYLGLYIPEPRERHVRTAICYNGDVKLTTSMQMVRHHLAHLTIRQWTVDMQTGVAEDVAALTSDSQHVSE